MWHIPITPARVLRIQAPLLGIIYIDHLEFVGFKLFVGFADTRTSLNANKCFSQSCQKSSSASVEGQHLSRDVSLEDPPFNTTQTTGRCSVHVW